MKVAVLGLGHLGTVIAAGLASLGHDVVGVDTDERRIAHLNAGVPPMIERDLAESIRRGLESGELRFAAELRALRGAQVVWVAYDTPVDSDGRADIGWVFSRIEGALRELGQSTETGPIVLVSSQLPVGSVARLEALAAAEAPTLRFACSPENLRVGQALADFLYPHRIVIGVRSADDRGVLAALLGRITSHLEWMSVESAEMTKHALNAFLAVSVAYANEIASLCKAVGADAKEVERGLKTDVRIGPRAYLAPGGPFAGATLARDVGYLNDLASRHEVTTPLVRSILSSNEHHESWARDTLRGRCAPLSTLTVALWGLAYKPDTDALQGSRGVALCEWLIGEGAKVHVHDARIRALPPAWGHAVRRFDDPTATLEGAQALIVAGDSYLYRALSIADLRHRGARLVVLDADRVLRLPQEGDPGVDYFAPGHPAPSASTAVSTPP